jgi:hexosaminidase
VVEKFPGLFKTIRLLNDSSLQTDNSMIGTILHRIASLLVSRPVICDVYDIAYARPRIIPEPVSVRVIPGYFIPTADLSVCYDPAVTGFQSLATHIQSMLPRILSVKVRTTTECSDGDIILRKYQVDPGAYFINVSTQSIIIGGPDRQSVYYGWQSLRQIFPPLYHALVPESASIQCCYIEDRPRLQWRGLTLDVSHQFFGMTALENLIRQMAVHKLNVLQLHISDQFWRLDLPSFPNLTHGMREFYTGPQIRELIEFAKDYEIEIIPEIEMPGRVYGLISAYPGLSCHGNISVPSFLCIGNPDTFIFVKKLLEETFEIFDSHYLHIGGDILPTHQFETCPKCRALMEKQGLHTQTDLYGYFVKQIRKLAKARGKTVIIRNPPPDLALHSSIIVTGDQNRENNTFISASFAFDKPQLQSDSHEGAAGILTLRGIYGFDPGGSAIGIQATVWTEKIRSEAELSYQVLTRLAALSEISWTPKWLLNWGRFNQAVAGLHRHLMSEGYSSAPYQAQPFAVWTPADVSHTWGIIAWPADRAFPVAANYTVQFHWVDGAGLEVARVWLLTEGKWLVAEDAHLGMAGPASVDNVFRLTVERSQLALEMRVSVKGAGGGSSGEVFVDFALDNA